LDGTSQWITGPEARADSHRLRKESQAVLVGVNTVLADDPELTHRLPGSAFHPETVDNDKQPMRVVIDPQGRSLANRNLKLFDQTKAKSLFIVKGGQGCIFDLEDIEVIYMDKIDLDEILKKLADRGVLQLFVEGGAITLSQFLANNLVNEFVVYQAPKFFPGRNFLESSIPATIADVEAWKIEEFDVKLVLTPRFSPF
jgi:diaminohydroxyphosphoribosylaminopyrimidine deaminase/5-amino-6-(5-phosphoribosylamino)uracil reductase